MSKEAEDKAKQYLNSIGFDYSLMLAHFNDDDKSQYEVYELMQEFAEAYHAEKSKWISVEDRLPEEDEYVFIWYNGEPQKVYRDIDHWFWMEKDKSIPVKNTKWQPLPTPPND